MTQFRLNDVVDWHVPAAGAPPRTPPFILGVVRSKVIHVHQYEHSEDQVLILQPEDWLKAGDVLDADLEYSEIREMEEENRISEVAHDECTLVSRPACCAAMEKEVVDAFDGAIAKLSTGQYRLHVDSPRIIPIQYCPWCGQSLQGSLNATS